MVGGLAAHRLRVARAPTLDQQPPKHQATFRSRRERPPSHECTHALPQHPFRHRVPTHTGEACRALDGLGVSRHVGRPRHGQLGHAASPASTRAAANRP